MEYILTEILKNSFRATVEHHHKQHNNNHPHPHPHSHSHSQSHTHTQYPLPPVLITIAPPPRLPGLDKPATLSLRIRDQGGGVSPPNMARIFSYAFTTAGRRASSTRHGRSHSNNDDDGKESSKDEDMGAGGGPYAAQYIGGAAAVGSDMGAVGGIGLFGEITGKGVQMGLGTIAGLGFGLPMSRLYAQ